MPAVIVSISVLVIVLAVMSVRFVVMSVVMTESVVSLAVMSVWGIRLLVVSAGAVMSVRGGGRGICCDCCRSVVCWGGKVGGSVF